MKIQKISNKNLKIESSLLFDGILVGILAGIIGVLYRFIISLCEKVIHFFSNNIQVNSLYIVLLIALLAFTAILSGYFLKKEPYASGSGIPQVSAEVTGRLNTKPFHVIFYKLLGGSVASLGGLSLGREGPSIQLGAMSGKAIAKIFKKNIIREKYLLTCGASAGLAVAFNAPLAGVLFSLEEVHKHISKRLIICCFSSAVVANIIGQYIFGLSAIFTFPNIKPITIPIYFWCAILGILLGIFGTFYNISMKYSFKFYGKLNWPIIFRPSFAFIISFFMFLFFPVVLGSGHDLVNEFTKYKYTLLFLIFLYFIKTIFSVISFTSGVAGGIFLPILVQGAILGAIFSNFFNYEHVTLFVILSMAGYLTAVVRSPITSIILLFEMTQKISFFLPIAICCLFAYYTANALGTKPVYEYLLDRLLIKEKDRINFDETEIEIITTVTYDSPFYNKYIKNIEFPRNVLIANIERNGKAIIARGDTLLEANDQLIIYMPKNKVDDFIKKFDLKE